ncbi:MAG: hypothetical protein IJO20_03200 [Ruminococcus sp.]|nr:hypothetical protein [Ruminococcus sp.]
MAQFYAKWTPMITQATAVATTGQKLNLYNAIILSESLDLPFSSDVNYRIKSALKNVRVRMNKSARKVERLSAALGQVALVYRNTEQKLTTVAKSDIIINPADRPEISWDWDDTWNMIGSGGIIGSTIAAIGGLITGGVTTKNILKTTKNAAKTVEKVAKSLSEPTFDWKHLLGLNMKEGKSLSEAFQSQIDDLNFGKAKTTSAKVAVGAKWAGYGLTAIMSAYDNFVVETEGNSTGRKIAETIGETVVDIAVGAGIAAVAATVGAPAVVTAAAGVLVKWAADSVSEHFTGKDFTELVSDGVLDAAESVGKAAKKAGKAISGWWKKTFG